MKKVCDKLLVDLNLWSNFDYFEMHTLKNWDGEHNSEENYFSQVGKSKNLWSNWTGTKVSTFSYIYHQMYRPRFNTEVSLSFLFFMHGIWPGAETEKWLCS